MNDEHARKSYLGRIAIIVATVILLGQGWAGMHRQPGPEVTYVAMAYAAADAIQDPRECEPAKGATTSCIFE